MRRQHVNRMHTRTAAGLMRGRPVKSSWRSQEKLFRIDDCKTRQSACAHTSVRPDLQRIARPVFHHLMPDQGSGHPPTLGGPWRSWRALKQGSERSGTLSMKPPVVCWKCWRPWPLAPLASFIGVPSIQVREA
jgi:hypothetical protein